MILHFSVDLIAQICVYYWILRIVFVSHIRKSIHPDYRFVAALSSILVCLVFWKAEYLLAQTLLYESPVLHDQYLGV